jgi:hypothetical protein
LKREKGKRARQLGCRLAPAREAIFYLPFSIFLILAVLGGCGSPGEPIERKPPVPAAISDLSAEQAGNTVVLTFTLPRESLDHRILKEPPDIEIYRGFSGRSPANTTAAQAATPSLLVTIPSAMVAHYSEQGRIRYTDALKAQDFVPQLNETAVYMVRTRASRKQPSPNSNVAGLRIYPAPEPIQDLKAEIAHSEVELSWTAPQKTLIGPVPPIKAYAIYRALVASAPAKSPAPKGTGAESEQPGALQPGAVQQKAAGVATETREPTELKPLLMKIAETPSPNYEDSQVQYNSTYTYAIRSMVEYSGEEIESGDSNLATILVRDVVPPSAPQGLVIVLVPAEAQTQAHLDLSWSINPETDIEGYNVYRTEEQGTPGTKLNAALLPTPTYSDMSVVAGHRYFYSVTAVDRAGNESSRSSATAGEVPAENQPKP